MALLASLHSFLKIGLTDTEGKTLSSFSSFSLVLQNLFSVFSVSIPTASRQNDDSDLSDNDEDGPPPIPPRDAYVRNGKPYNILSATSHLCYVSLLIKPFLLIPFRILKVLLFERATLN